jgi:hypothetical protein
MATLVLAPLPRSRERCGPQIFPATFPGVVQFEVLCIDGRSLVTAEVGRFDPTFLPPGWREASRLSSLRR